MSPASNFKTLSNMEICWTEMMLNKVQPFIINYNIKLSTDGVKSQNLGVVQIKTQNFKNPIEMKISEFINAFLTAIHISATLHKKVLLKA